MEIKHQNNNYSLNAAFGLDRKNTIVNFADRFIEPIVNYLFDDIGRGIYVNLLCVKRIYDNKVQSKKSAETTTKHAENSYIILDSIANKPSFSSAAVMKVFKFFDKGAFTDTTITNSTIESLEQLRSEKGVHHFVGSTGYLTGKVLCFRDNLIWEKKTRDNKKHHQTWTFQFVKNLTYTSLSAVACVARVADFIGVGLATTYLAGALVVNVLQDTPNLVGYNIGLSKDRDKQFEKTYLTGDGCKFAKSLVYTGGISFTGLVMDIYCLFAGIFGMLRGIIVDVGSLCPEAQQRLFPPKPKETTDDNASTCSNALTILLQKELLNVGSLSRNILLIFSLSAVFYTLFSDRCTNQQFQHYQFK